MMVKATATVLGDQPGSRVMVTVTCLGAAQQDGLDHLRKAGLVTAAREFGNSINTMVASRREHCTKSYRSRASQVMVF